MQLSAKIRREGTLLETVREPWGFMAVMVQKHKKASRRLPEDSRTESRDRPTKCLQGLVSRILELVYLI